jgi:hypothetical protein
MPVVLQERGPRLFSVRSIRIVTLNLWNDAGNVQKRMSVLVPQLVALQPHVVGLQEVREGSQLKQAQLIADALKADFRFAAADPDSPRGPIGNAVVSRLPIVSHAVLPLPAPPGDPRNALRCELESPAGRLSFITTHIAWELDAAPGPSCTRGWSSISPATTRSIPPTTSASSPKSPSSPSKTASDPSSLNPSKTSLIPWHSGSK